MKIIALYKVWSGAEFLAPSIASIYDFNHKIVILTSNISWIGQSDNPSLPEIERIKEDCDPENKIIHINHDEINQLKHCEYGYNYIKKNFTDVDFIQLIDSDEVWHRGEMEKAVKYLETADSTADAFRVNTYTYIKSPFYRVDPPEAIKPVCFIRPRRKNMGCEPRGCGIHPFKIMPDVWMNHFAWVRYHVNETMIKIIQSHVVEKQPMHNIPNWIVNKWNKLPHANDFHIAVGFATQYKAIKVIRREDLPEVLRGGIPIIMQFDKRIQ